MTTAREIEPTRLVVGIVAALVAVNVVSYLLPDPWDEFVIPAAAVLLLVLVRRAGLSWAELGLARGTWGRGARFGLIALALIAVVVAIAAALPWTQSLFLDDRYRNGAGAALFTAFVLIPLRTVLPEEIAFRGVLLAALMRRYATRTSVLVSSVLFGLWHVTSSLGLAAGNDAVADAGGSGTAGQVLGVLASVAATTVAGVVLCWFRLRSGSLVAPVLVHWAVNGVAVLASAVVWAVTT